jgi:hypothetical protein
MLEAMRTQAPPELCISCKLLRHGGIYARLCVTIDNYYTTPSTALKYPARN